MNYSNEFKPVAPKFLNSVSTWDSNRNVDAKDEGHEKNIDDSFTPRPSKFPFIMPIQKANT